MVAKWDYIESHWDEIRAKIKERWSRLTEDELDLIAGNRDQLIGALQEEYGFQERDAEQEVDAFCGNYCESS